MKARAIASLNFALSFGNRTIGMALISNIINAVNVCMRATVVSDSANLLVPLLCCPDTRVAATSTSNRGYFERLQRSRGKLRWFVPYVFLSLL